jgi:hypothetical protein
MCWRVWVGRQWRIRTTFGWVSLRVRTPGEPSSTLDSAGLERERRARFLLLYELRTRLVQPSEAIHEVRRFFRGDGGRFGARERPPSAREIDAFERTLDSYLLVRHIELDLEPFPIGSISVEEQDTPIPELGPAKPQPAPDSSFIAVSLLDQDENPVVGRRWTIELPDGSKHEGQTDAQGWARVRGFRKDGNAKVTFPGFDELDHKTRVASERVIIPLSGEAAAAATADAAATDFIEFTIVDADGTALPNVAYSLTLEDGSVLDGQTDREGFARVEGVGGASAKLQVTTPLTPASGA